MRLCVLSDQKRQLHLRQPGQNRRVPGRRAFAPRRFVAAARVDAGITKSHGHDGDARLVVEGVTVDRQPIAQALARAVVPGNPGFVHPRTRSLADNQQARI